MNNLQQQNNLQPKEDKIPEIKRNESPQYGRRISKITNYNAESPKHGRRISKITNYDAESPEPKKKNPGDQVLVTEITNMKAELINAKVMMNKFMDRIDQPPTEKYPSNDAQNQDRYNNSNRKQNSHQNMNQNVQENHNQNVQQNHNQNFQQNHQQNVQQNHNQNVQQNMHQNVQQNHHQNVQQNHNQNVQQNHNQNVQQNHNQNVQQNMHQNGQQMDYHQRERKIFEESRPKDENKERSLKNTAFQKERERQFGSSNISSFGSTDNFPEQKEKDDNFRNTMFVKPTNYKEQNNSPFPQRSATSLDSNANKQKHYKNEESHNNNKDGMNLHRNVKNQHNSPMDQNNQPSNLEQNSATINHSNRKDYLENRYDRNHSHNPVNDEKSQGNKENIEKDLFKNEKQIETSKIRTVDTDSLRRTTFSRRGDLDIEYLERSSIRKSLDHKPRNHNDSKNVLRQTEPLMSSNPPQKDEKNSNNLDVIDLKRKREDLNTKLLKYSNLPRNLNQRKDKLAIEKEIRDINKQINTWNDTGKFY